MKILTFIKIVFIRNLFILEEFKVMLDGLCTHIELDNNIVYKPRFTSDIGWRRIHGYINLDRKKKIWKFVFFSIPQKILPKKKKKNID